MEQDARDALLGQLSADATLLHALTTTVMALVPASRAAIEQRVEATALLEKQHLPAIQRLHYEQRIEELRAIWREEPPMG